MSTVEMKTEGRSKTVVSVDRALGSRDVSAFQPKEEEDLSMKERIVDGAIKKFVDNIPVDVIKTMSTSKLVTFGLIAYGIVIGIFLYFAISGYIQARKEEYVSLDSSSGQCEEVVRTLTGTYYASSDGIWEGSVGYQYTNSIYRFSFQGMKTTDAQFKDTLNKLKKDQLVPVGAKQEQFNLAYNLLVWMHYSTQFTIGDSVQLFGMSGDPADVFGLDYVFGGIANNQFLCDPNPVISYDITISTMTMSYDAETYNSDTSCTSVASMEELGYKEQYDGSVFNIELDLVSLTSALAVNLNILSSVYLESVGDILEFGEYGGIAIGFQLFFDPRFVIMYHTVTYIIQIN